jgi:hypothetical protein
MTIARQRLLRARSTMDSGYTLDSNTQQEVTARVLIFGSDLPANLIVHL